MAECIGCGKKLSILSGKNKISENCELCDRCYSIFSTKLNIMKASKDESTIEELYQSVIDQISNYDYTDNGKKIILEFVNEQKNIVLNNFQMERDKALELENEKEAQIAFERKCNTAKLSTGYNFEGYDIRDYLGIVSGETVIGTGFLSEFSASISDLTGTEDNAFASKLSVARTSAIKQLIRKVVTMGGNAVIGIDFDYITFSNNMIGVIANGTAVAIEKRDNTSE